jgi:hypothetical protein
LVRGVRLHCLVPRTGCTDIRTELTLACCCWLVGWLEQLIRLDHGQGTTSFSFYQDLLLIYYMTSLKNAALRGRLIHSHWLTVVVVVVVVVAANCNCCWMVGCCISHSLTHSLTHFLAAVYLQLRKKRLHLVRGVRLHCLVPRTGCTDIRTELTLVVVVVVDWYSWYDWITAKVRLVYLSIRTCCLYITRHR